MHQMNAAMRPADASLKSGMEDEWMEALGIRALFPSELHKITSGKICSNSSRTAGYLLGIVEKTGILYDARVMQ